MMEGCEGFHPAVEMREGFNKGSGVTGGCDEISHCVRNEGKGLMKGR